MTSDSLRRLARRLCEEYSPLPVQSVGGMSIEQVSFAAGKILPVVQVREALFSGLPVTDLVLSKPYKVQKLLSEEDGTWMSNMPCELVQQWREFASRARGNVLVGGLGLGAVVSMLIGRTAVRSITVVEVDPRVIFLNSSRRSAKLSVIQDDLVAFLAKSKPHYDQAYFDTWQNTGEWVWQTQVAPLRRMAAAHIPRVVCWQEEVMVGQVLQGLFRAANIPAEQMLRKANCHWYAFRRGLEKLGLVGRPRLVDPQDFKSFFLVEEENRKNPVISYLARQFVAQVGLLTWEKNWGRFWDEAFNIEESIHT